MGRHTMVNPTTGRTIFKTGALGRKVQKMQSMKNHKTAASGRVKSKPKAKAKTSAKKHVKAFKSSGSPYYTPKKSCTTKS